MGLLWAGMAVGNSWTVDDTGNFDFDLDCCDLVQRVDFCWQYIVNNLR